MQNQQAINIAAPGFGGINTEESPLQTDMSFCAVADNCVIDRYGRLGARRGWEGIEGDVTAWNGQEVRVIHEHISTTANTDPSIITVVDAKVWKGIDPPEEITPVGGIVYNERYAHQQVGQWSVFAAPGRDMFFYKDDPLAIPNNATFHEYLVADPLFSTRPTSGVILGAWGRLFTYDRFPYEGPAAYNPNQQGRIFWSNLLIPYDFDAGDSGELILDGVWPQGNDDVVALAAHNEFLVVLGTRQVLIFSGANGDPGTDLTLVDSIVNIGCIARDSVVSTGADLLWLDDTGVRGLNRLIQERSLPINDLGKNVRSELLEAVAGEDDNENINGIYSPEQGLYLLHFPTSGYVYAFHIQRPLDDGSVRATRWTGLQRINCLERTSTGKLLAGSTATVGEYTNFTDWGDTYVMRWYSNPFQFGSPSNMKFPKNASFIIIGGLGQQFNVEYAFNFQTDYRTAVFNIPLDAAAQYNISEYNTGAEYTAGIAVRTKRVNLGGQGRAVTLAVSTTVLGPCSLQEINIIALIGRYL